MKFTLSLAVIAMAAVSFSQSFTSTGGPYVIPDNNPGGVTATVNVTGPVGALQSVSFTGLAHTFIGDLTVSLTDPGSNSVFVLQRTGWTGVSTNFGSGYDFLAANSYTFSVGGSTIWGLAGSSVPSGTYRPSANSGTGSEVQTNFAALSGTGTWNLFVSDAAAADTGGFTSVTLNFEPVPEPATMAALGVGVVALLRRRKKA